MRWNATQFARLPRVVAALRAGRISHDMAQAIAAAVSCSGSKTDSGVVADVEDALPALALDEMSSPGKVALVGRHLCSVVDPDGELSDEDKAYGNRCLISMVDDKGGMTGRFYLPPVAAAKLQQVLDAYAKPRSAADDRTKAQRSADALIALLDGKVSTQIMVLVNAETLPDTPTSGSGAAARHDHGDRTGMGGGRDGPDGTVNGHAAKARADVEGTGDLSDTGDLSSDLSDTGDLSSDLSDTGGTGGEDSSDGSSGHQRATDTGGDEWCPELDEQAMEKLRVALMNIGQPPPGHANSPGSPGGSVGPGGSGSPGSGGGCASDQELSDWGAPGVKPDAGPGGPAGPAGSGVGPGVGVEPEMDPLPCPTCDRPANRNTPGLLMPTGHLLPARHTRRLLYTSQLFRVVLDAKSRILDTSYSTRFVPEWIRRLILTRYPTCGYDDCPIEAKHCQLDHVFNWADHHRTRADEIIPACSHHNRDRAQHPHKYRLHKNPDNTWHFTTIKRS